MTKSFHFDRKKLLGIAK
jgi:hypothetical protein